MLTGVTAIRYNNEFRTGQNLGFLLGCIGEKISVEIDFFWEDIFIVTADETVIAKPSIQLIGSLLNPQELVYCSFANAFADYEVGDIMRFSYSGTNFTVTEKIGNNILRFGGENFTTTTLLKGQYVFRINELRAVNYRYNLLDTGSTYTSLIDGEEQRLSVFLSGAAYNAMAFLGIKSYQIGSCQAKIIGFSSGRYTYTIKHDLYITPFFLSSQYADLLARNKPSYFAGVNCLKYIYKIGLNRSNNSPTGEQFITRALDANTGWFNETFNGGLTNYSIFAYTLTRVSDSASLTALEFTNEIDAIITIKNTTNSPFINGVTKFVLNFCYLPESATLYQNNGRNMTSNFAFDRCYNIANNANANGDNFGTGMQVIKTMKVEFISTSEVKVTARIQVGATAESIMTEGDFSRYMLWVTTENTALSASNSDKVALLTDVNSFYVQLTESDLITNETLFISHPYTDIADATDTVDVFPTDDIAAVSKFSIDFTGRELEGIKIKKINPKLTLVKSGSPTITLEDYVLDTSAYPTIASLFQNINFAQDRVFKINAGDIRKVITAVNDFSIDAGGVHNWSFNYPFMVRWEYWITLLGLSNPTADVFDTAEPLNGINNFWHRFTAITGWQLQYSIGFIFEQNGATATQTFTNAFESYDFNSNPQWTSESIKSYDINTLAELVSGGTKFIQGYQKTKLKSTFVWFTGSPPLLTDIGIVFWVERFESSGINEVVQISSFRVVDSSNVFTGINGDGLVVVALTGSTFTGECYIDQSKLPSGSKYTVYSRLYHLPILFDSKQFEDSAPFNFEDGDAYYFE